MATIEIPDELLARIRALAHFETTDSAIIGHLVERASMPLQTDEDKAAKVVLRSQALAQAVSTAAPGEEPYETQRRVEAFLNILLLGRD